MTEGRPYRGTPRPSRCVAGGAREARARPLHAVPRRRGRALLSLLWLALALVLVPAGGVRAAPGDAELSRTWREFLGEPARHDPQPGYPFEHCFTRSARLYDLPEALLLAVGRGESALDPLARSHADAYGLMQIRWPLTARHLGLMRRGQLLDPCTNVDAGARYLRELLGRYGDVHRALAAYNMGPSRVPEQRHRPVPEAGRRYSAYIYRQLGRDARDPAPGGPLVAAAPRQVAAPAVGTDAATPGDTVTGAAARRARAAPPAAASVAEAAVREGEASAAPPGGEAARAAFPREHELVSFASPIRARSLLAALSQRFPRLDLKAQARPWGGHAVTLTTQDLAAYRHARNSLAPAGFDLPPL